MEWALDHAISEIVKYRQFKQNLSEDQLTVELASALTLMGIPTSHDPAYGGHTDLAIEMRLGFLWMGEAKIWRGSSWAFKGLRQLVTRYSTGMPDQTHGGLILYYYNQNAAILMSSWRDRLIALAKLTAETEIINSISFRSAHNHPAVGQNYHVRHFGVPLFWKPDDK